MFDAVVTFDDSKEEKTFSKTIQSCIRKIKLKKEEVVMIGDWPEESGWGK